MRLSTLSLTLALCVPASSAWGQDPAPVDADAAEAPVDKTWLVRTARMEGAADDLTQAAALLQKSSRAVAEAGRVERLAEVLSHAQDLHRQVVSAKLAAEVLDQPL